MQVKEISDPTETFEQNSEGWRRHVAVEDYIARELKLNSFFPCRYWGVFEGDQLVASCRACIREAIASDKQGKEACIGNVFTPQEFRGKGYAGYLLSAVTEQLKKECILVGLWSDVGEFYAKFGYKMVPNTKKIIVDVSKQENWPAQVTAVAQAKVPEYIDKQTAAIQQNLKGGQVAVAPSVAYYKYWIEETLLNASFEGRELPDIWGAATDSSWCLWFYDLGRTKSLTILAWMVLMLIN